MLNGGRTAFFIRFHEIGTGQKFVRGIYALQIFPRNIHELGKSRARTDEDRFVAVFLFEFLDGNDAADDHVRFHLDAERLQVIHFFLHDRLRKTEFGNAVDKNAARHVERLVNRHVVSEFRKIPRTGKPCGTGTDHSHFVSVRRNGCRFFGRVHIMIIRDKSFQSADADGFAARLDAAGALAFALRFLRTDAAADRGQRAGKRNDLISAFKISFRHLGNKFGDGDIDGTARHAGTIFAV